MKPRWWVLRVINDSSLPCDARTLLLWLGLRPAGWRYSVDEAVRAMGVERKKYQRLLATLKAAGWIVVERPRDRHGCIKFTRLVIRDTASPEGANSTLRQGLTGRCRMKPTGPEGANSTLSRAHNTRAGAFLGREDGETEQVPSLRLIVGGRDA